MTIAKARAKQAAVVDMVTGGSTVAATVVVVPVPDPLAPVLRKDDGSMNTNELPPEVNLKPEERKKQVS